MRGPVGRVGAGSVREVETIAALGVIGPAMRNHGPPGAGRPATEMNAPRGVNERETAMSVPRDVSRRETARSALVTDRPIQVRPLSRPNGRPGAVFDRPGGVRETSPRGLRRRRASRADPTMTTARATTASWSRGSRWAASLAEAGPPRVPRSDRAPSVCAGRSGVTLGKNPAGTRSAPLRNPTTPASSHRPHPLSFGPHPGLGLGAF